MLLAVVEVLGRYSNRCDQGERIQALLEIVPEGPVQVKIRTRQVQHRLRPDEVEDLIKRYQAGAGVCELASIFSVHRDTVSDTLRRHNVPRRQQGIPSTLLDQVAHDYLNGSSLATIGVNVSVDPRTVGLALRKAGVKLRPRNGWD